MFNKKNVENKENKNQPKVELDNELVEKEINEKNKITRFGWIKNLKGKLRKTYKTLKYIAIVVIVLIICIFIGKSYTKNVYPYFDFMWLNRKVKKEKSLYGNFSPNTSSKIENNSITEKNNLNVEDKNYNDFDGDFYENISDNSSDLIKYEILKSKIEKLENNILELQEIVAILQKNILEIENTNPANNEKNLQIVILLHKIENIILIGGDFTSYFEYLKVLTRNKNFIFENVLKLERYRIQKSQQELKKVFFKEYEKALAEKNDSENKLKILLNDNIKVRKIGNFKEDIDNIDLNIRNIENSIEKFDYNRAIDIILNNNYEDKFSNTLNILYEKGNALSSVNEILDFIYGM